MDGDSKPLGNHSELPKPANSQCLTAATPRPPSGSTVCARARWNYKEGARNYKDFHRECPIEFCGRNQVAVHVIVSRTREMRRVRLPRVGVS